MVKGGINCMVHLLSDVTFHAFYTFIAENLRIAQWKHKATSESADYKFKWLEHLPR